MMNTLFGRRRYNDLSDKKRAKVVLSNKPPEADPTAPSQVNANESQQFSRKHAVGAYPGLIVLTNYGTFGKLPDQITQPGLSGNAGEKQSLLLKNRSQFD